MKILLVGSSGFAAGYVRTLLDNNNRDAVFEGIVDPYFDRCPYKDEIYGKGIPVYDSMDAFYKEHTADLAVISAPTFLHCEQAVCALANGSHVLCEKPVAPPV